MGTMMMSHVDETAGKGNSAKCRFADGFGRSDKGNNGAIGGLSGIYVEQLDAFAALDFGANGTDDVHVASLTEVGDAFDDAVFHLGGINSYG